MNVLLGSAVLLLVVVGFILADAKELGEVVKGGITLIVLCAISGFVVALASGSM